MTSHSLPLIFAIITNFRPCLFCSNFSFKSWTQAEHAIILEEAFRVIEKHLDFGSLVDRINSVEEGTGHRSAKAARMTWIQTVKPNIERLYHMRNEQKNGEK